MARVQTIWAEKLRPGDVLVEGERRRVVAQVRRPSAERIHVRCEDGSMPMLSPTRPIKIERGGRS